MSEAKPVYGLNHKDRLKLLTEYEGHKRNAQLLFYEPYPKQKQFHAAAQAEKAAICANQSGKTHCAAAEIAVHATGWFPPWWEGRRFANAPQIWIGSETAELTRDGAQVKLLGAAGQWGTGLIPKAQIADIKMSRGTPNAVELAHIRHSSGEISEIVFKAFADGREKWQAGTVDIVWLDEEPPEEIYNEALVRVQAKRGFVMLTLTPLKGLTNVAHKFLDTKSREDAGRFVIQWTIEDAPHFSVEQRREMESRYAPHEREARLKGIPMLGSGRVFPLPESWVTVKPFPIPDHWPVIGGIDIGWDHPTAAVKCALDPETKTFYVASDYRAKELTPVLHASALKGWGRFPWAWPHDALSHDKGSGEQIAAIYRKHGLSMVHTHAQFPDERGNGVEAGLWAMLEDMQMGRFKVFETCVLWLEEFRIYHRKVKDGRVQIVKEREDVISASRYAYMMQRYARPKVRPEDRHDRYSKPRLKYMGSGWMSA